MRKLIIQIGTVAFVVILSACSSEAEKKDDIKKAEILPLVKVEKANRETFRHEVRVQGTVETDKNSVIGAEMGGTIVEVKVKEGQEVQAGQVLVVIDASVLSANAQEINTQLEYARYMLEKQEELKKRGVGTDFDLETAKNSVKALESKLNSLQTQQGKALIKAPFSGVIDQVYATKGQIAGPQSPLMRIVNNSEVDVVTAISEKYITKVKEGSMISVSFPNYGDTSMNLKVTSVGNYIEPINRTFRIRANVKNNNWLLPNMLAEVKVADQIVENGLVIPSKSILKDGQNEDYVYILTEKDKKQIVVMQKVTVLGKYETKALIADDGKIKEGDRIVTEGARGIENNEQVRIKE